MKTQLLALFLAFQLNAGNWTDRHITERERQIVQAVYYRWTLRWGGSPRRETPSTMLWLMLSNGRGVGLTPAERHLLDRIETLIKSR